MQDSQWLRDNNCGVWQHRQQQCWIVFLLQESAKRPPFPDILGVDAKYAKHWRVFGEMCVVADTDNKVGMT